MQIRCGLPIALFVALWCFASWSGAAPRITKSPTPKEVDPYDIVEVTLQVSGMTVENAFSEVVVRGSFNTEGGQQVAVDGFCDSTDGSVHRIRFMPPAPGSYSYSVSYTDKTWSETVSGKFKVRDVKKKGMLRVDRANPFHFAWEGTGEHYFWNGTTAYWLLGWEDEGVIKAAIDRLAALKVNRIRVALCGRTESGARWDEPKVTQTDKFKFRLNPWHAARPDSPDDPGFDVSRFNLPFWQKCERMLAHARAKDMIVSLIFYLDGADKGVDPFGKNHPGSDDERRYYRYASARLGAYSNVTWDLSNEYRQLRDDTWANAMGEYLKSCDPYDHLTSVHGHADFHFRASGWADYCLFQQWDEHGGHDFMLKNRQEQIATGQPKPQINEEYGYEDHYPKNWGEGRQAPARNADSRRRLAWGICMAGGYQTTGERAGQGTETGGGWITGRGDDQMSMLKGYAQMVDFFQGFEWWKTEPREDLLKEKDGYCLAEVGRLYALYLPKGGTVTVKLEAGPFRAEWFNPRSGERKPLADVPGGKDWTSPKADSDDDWALLLRKKE